MDDFEHRLLVGCLMTARNEYLHAGKPMEDVDDLILLYSLCFGQLKIDLLIQGKVFEKCDIAHNTEVIYRA